MHGAISPPVWPLGRLAWSCLGGPSPPLAPRRPMACQWHPAGIRSIFDYYAKHLPGFYVGRFDVMTPNVDSILKGQFSVIGVNGAMSEIWDETKCGSRIQWKGHRVFMGWRHMLLLRAQNPFEMVRVMFGAFRRANGCGLSEFQWCPSSSS